MRKNKFMRLASALLVLTLLSTCAISGTFAKYVTSGEATDSARVAKWGVKVTANGTMFADKYDSADSATVVGQGEVKVVAPGTKGTMTTMTLTGKPEVAAKVTYKATVDLNNLWKDKDGNFYFPLKIKVNNEAVDLSAATDATGVKAAIEAEINGYSKEYPAGTDLSTVGTDSVAVSWEWPYYTDANSDVKDTFLGDQANDGKAGTISVKIETTVTQID